MPWTMKEMEWLGGKRASLPPGSRLEAIAGASGAERLIRRLLQDDPAAHSELNAIYLLRSRYPISVVEIDPEITVDSRTRNPDFRIRWENRVLDLC